MFDLTFCVQASFPMHGHYAAVCTILPQHRLVCTSMHCLRYRNMYPHSVLHIYAGQYAAFVFFTGSPSAAVCMCMCSDIVDGKGIRFPFAMVTHVAGREVTHVCKIPLPRSAHHALTLNGIQMIRQPCLQGCPTCQSMGLTRQQIQACIQACLKLCYSNDD